MMSTSQEVEAVVAALRVFVAPGRTTSVQTFRPHKRCLATADLETAAKLALRWDALSPQGVYFSPNPLAPDWEGRTAFPADKDVIARHWLLIDVDPVRAHPDGSKVSATIEERRFAWDVLDRCHGACDGAGLNGAVVGDSGNGWNLNYPVLLPNDQESKDLVKSVLAGLNRTCTDDHADVGVECHDARRIWPCWGTMKRKGPADLPDRPYRPTRIIEGPAWDEETARYNNGQLRRLLEMWTFQEQARKRKPVGSVVDRARAYLTKVEPAISGQHGHDRTFHVACLLVKDFGLSEDQAFEAVGDWNARCQPPWSEAELRHKFADAAKSPGPRGKLLGEQKPKPAPNYSTAAAPKEPPEGKVIIRFGLDIEPKQVSWLWPNHIPLGMLTTFAGQTKKGKTFVAVEIMSRVTTGASWPDGSAGDGEVGKVLFITGDDSIEYTLIARLTEAGADLRQVVFLTEDDQGQWTMNALGTLDRALAQAVALGHTAEPVRLVVIDPPTSFMCGVDDHKNVELRAILTPFKAWAEARKVAVVFITHFNKGGSSVDAIMRVMGGAAWTSSVRVAFAFVDDPNDPDRRLFCCLGTNLGPDPKTLAYRIVSGTASGKVEWLGEVETTANEAVGSGQRSRPRKVVASEWLVERFREKLEWPSDELFRAAAANGVSRNAIFEAKDSLCLPKARKVTHEDGRTEWVWWVPAEWPQLAEHSPPTQ